MRAASAMTVLYGYVTRDGKTSILYRYSHAKSFSEGLALVSAHGGKKLARPHFIDTAGAPRLELPAGASDAEPFSDGLAMLVFYEKGIRRYAWMDKTGTIQVEGTFREARSFTGGLVL